MLTKNIKIILLCSVIIFLTCNCSFAENNTITQYNSTNLNEGNLNNTILTNSVVNNSNGYNNSTKAIVPVNNPKTISQSNILIAAKYVKTYTEKYGKLPNYVTISSYKYSMPEFMYLMSKTINYKYNNIKSSITVKYNIKNPVSPTGNSINKQISKKTYYSLSTAISKYIEKYNTSPKYVSSSFGKIQYQTAIYGFSRILTYSYSYNKLPNYLSLKIKNTNSINKNLPKYTPTTQPSNNLNNTTTVNNTSNNNSTGAIKPTKLSQNSILVASSLLKNYIEANGKLPNYITISSYNYSIPEFLYLISKVI
ncbi:MAG: pseudomurein-binding repeat-containing protein, partial [Methanobacteriaceae archaeon]